MPICAFFGHRDIHVCDDLCTLLEKTISDLISQGVNEFWCCDNGTFDWLSRTSVHNVIEREFNFKAHYFLICYVCAYNPTLFSKEKLKWLEEKKYDILYPKEIESVPKKYAIKRRNQYIAENADYIICYVDHDFGGAYDAVQIAINKGKKVINLAKEN